MSKRYNLVKFALVKNTSLEKLAENIVDNIDPSNIPTLIALIDNKVEDLKITEEIINHFESIKPAYFDGIPQEDRNMVPKNLL